MKSIRTTTLVMSILLAAAAGMTAAQEATQAVQDTSRLTEFGERRANEIQPPNLVMDILGIRPGMVIGEVGAGRGRVTVHLAVRVGEKGKVYANDIDPRAIESLEKRCRRLGLANVETILSLPDDARFPQNMGDRSHGGAETSRSRREGLDAGVGRGRSTRGRVYFGRGHRRPAAVR
ncbi:MAG: ubiquinone/menaquinone biosynthesismethyltransferase [Candidatus Aminicenantes bacterium]|nr:ubiquinone/menaquinone biosynthesismethyltransferase [Candidatus Aminicenantes bacterium]